MATDPNAESVLGTNTDEADGSADSTTDGGDETADELAERLAGYVERSELSRLEQGIASRLGRVSAVQRDLAKVARAHEDTVATATSTSELLTAVVQALIPQLSEDSAERRQLENLLTSHRSKAQVAQILAERLGDLGLDDDDEDSEAEQADPAWVAANAAVEAYAEGKGLNPSLIPEAEYGRVQRAVEAAGGGPREAIAAMKKVVDTLAAKQGRRDTNRTATTTTPARGGKPGGGRALTPESMRAMTVDEIRAIPREERMAALGR